MNNIENLYPVYFIRRFKAKLFLCEISRITDQIENEEIHDINLASHIELLSDINEMKITFYLDSSMYENCLFVSTDSDICGHSLFRYHYYKNDIDYIGESINEKCISGIMKGIIGD